jgi:hypothetical protein
MATANYEKKMYWLTVVMAVLAAVATLAAVAGWYYAAAADRRAIEAESRTKKADEDKKVAEQEKQVAEQEKRAAEEKLAKEINEQKDNLALFESGRENQMKSVSMALSKYKEVPNEQNLRDLRASARSLIDFVKKWREIIEIINKLLDGQVKSMEDALNNDVNALEQSITAYEQTSRIDGPLLNKAIERLSKERQANRQKPGLGIGSGTK